MEITDKILIKISLSGFFILFVLIYSLDSNIELNTKQINEISIQNLNEIVKINAKVTKQRMIGNNLFLTLEDDGKKIKAVAFNTDGAIDINKNYNFKGKVTLYQKELELIISEIKEI